MPEALFVNGDIAACFAASILKKELAWRLEGDTFLEREGIPRVHRLLPRS